MRYPAIHRTLTGFLKIHSFEEALRLLCAAAESSGQGDLYQQWALKKGERLRKDSVMVPAAWLKNRTGTRQEHLDTAIPGSDHLRYLTQPDGTRIVLSQPYALSWEELSSLVDWCRERDLEATLDCYSGHFPGRTLAVRITRGGA
jgi:hypothetical protein